jgi:hypothetical protein
MFVSDYLLQPLWATAYNPIEVIRMKSTSSRESMKMTAADQKAKLQIALRRIRQKEKLRRKRPRQMPALQSIPINPFAAPHCLEKPDLREFIVPDEWLEDALNFQIEKQFARDSLRDTVRRQMAEDRISLRRAWANAMAATTATYEMKGKAPLLKSRKVAGVFFLNRCRPPAEIAECDFAGNERKWYIGISLNRNRSAAAFLDWTLRELLPCVGAAARLIANIDMRGSVYFSDEHIECLLRNIHGSQPAEFKFWSCDRQRARACADKSRKMQIAPPQRLRARLLAIACYRFAQADFGWRAYHRAQEQISLESNPMTRELFRQRLKIAVTMLRDYAPFEIAHRLEHLPGFYFPLGKSFRARPV